MDFLISLGAPLLALAFVWALGALVSGLVLLWAMARAGEDWMVPLEELEEEGKTSK